MLRRTHFPIVLLVTAFIGNQNRVLAADPKTDEKTNIVVAEGVAKDEKEAKKAAFRDAVSKVVGTIVDAETIVKNDQVISDRILEYSGGFIKSYETLKTEKTADGLIRVRIKATVERNQILSKLQDAKVTTTEIKGSDLLAEKMTKEEARKNATELLAKLFEDLPKLMKAEVIGKPKLNDNGDAVLVDVVVGVDQKGYGEFVKKAIPLLDKLALAKDSVSLTAERDQLGMMKYSYETTQTFNKPDLGSNTPKGWAIWILTFIDGRYEKGRWNLCWVDADIAKSLKPLFGKKQLHITLNDKDDELVTEDEMEFQIQPECKSLIDRNKFRQTTEGMSYLYQPFPRTYKVNGDSRDTATMIVAPFTLNIYQSQPEDSPRILGYSVKMPLQRKIKITDKELERVKTIKASVLLKPSKDDAN